MPLTNIISPIPSTLVVHLIVLFDGIPVIFNFIEATDVFAGIAKNHPEPVSSFSTFILLSVLVTPETTV